jgi:hypothetical protein
LRRIKVMMAIIGPEPDPAAAAEAAAADAEDDANAAVERRGRRSKQPYEREHKRVEDIGTSAGPRDPIRRTVRDLERPVKTGADPTLVER